MRAWSAGTIHKDERLTMTGPYAYTRNPLYLGSLFIGIGVTLAGGHWVWLTLFLAYFYGVYGKTMREEAAHLGRLFPDMYDEYQASVPAFIPRLTPYRSGGGFAWSQYWRNREWEAALGVLAAFLLFAVKVARG